MKTVKIIIRGTVQGVFFRKFVKDNADALNVRGFVRNLGNGDVEVVAEGREENVNKLIELCKQGPPHAKVREVDIQEIKYQGFERFKILLI